MKSSDGIVLNGEILRPQSWVEANGIIQGQVLPFGMHELEVEGLASITSVSESPRLASGEGSFVTGRFQTHGIDEIVHVTVRGAEGELETVDGTKTHPVWSLDRNGWVVLGELEVGEQISGQAGPAMVLHAELLQHPTTVYNLEVHGHHVYQVGNLGLLVHNMCHAPKGTDYSMKAVRERWWGGKAPVRPNPDMPRGREYMELSHTYISNNGAIGKHIPDSIKNRGWNLKPMWGSEHALVDPHRYQFMKRSWKDANEIYSPMNRMLGRMPTSHKVGAGVIIVGGAGYGVYEYLDGD